MQITVTNIKLASSLDEASLISYLVNKYKISKLISGKLIKKSLDVRDKNKPFYLYHAILEIDKPYPKIRDKNVLWNTNYQDELIIPKINSKEKIIVVGFGPAGMFLSLILARAGLKPIIFERGSVVEKRVKDIDNYFKNGIFDVNSNVCFGEGGAGTFSDGKLTTNINDKRIKFILKTFIKYGAKESIYYDGYPHVGTDKLQIAVKGIREEIISLGGTFYFDTYVKDVKSGVITYEKDNQVFSLESKYIILAIGHSAKNTYKMLYKNGFNLEPKPFSMGVRIEHLQSKINAIQYGVNSNIHDPATYKFAVHLKNRDVYSFCMCPGGYVVASNSDLCEIVTNGMSYEARDGINANSALLVNVKVEDYYKSSPLDGIDYQASFEKACYSLTNSFKAPINLLKEFLRDEVASNYRSVIPTYPNGYVFSSFKDLLPDYVIESLKEAIISINKKMPGFLDDDAVLTAIESRSSSPVRIVRNAEYMTNILGVYPIGEGSGYAGGITSSALDGIKCAFKIIEKISGEKYES